jgi:hypothetical protein
LNWTEEQLRALYEREKRQVAIHEASHAVLIGKFGGLARPMIWRNNSDSFDEKAWLGRCYITGAPGQVTYQRGLKKQLGIVRTPKLWQVYVGLAGFVGEHVSDGENAAWSVRDDYQNALEDEEISATDVQMMGGRLPTERVFARTLEYVTRFWSEIKQEAEWLVHDADENSIEGSSQQELGADNVMSTIPEGEDIDQAHSPTPPHAYPAAAWAFPSRRRSGRSGT